MGGGATYVYAVLKPVDTRLSLDIAYTMTPCSRHPHPRGFWVGDNYHGNLIQWFGLEGDQRRNLQDLRMITFQTKLSARDTVAQWLA